MPDSPGRVAYAPNICQCGHDYNQHTNPGNLQTGTCSGCPGSIHGFCSDNEIFPTSEFPDTRPAGFVATPGPSIASNKVINHIGGYPVNTINLTLNSMSGVVPGMVAVFNPDVPARQSQCQIIGIIGPNIVLLAPGLQVAVNQGDTVSFVWPDGATPGPGLTANGQRGG